MIMGIVAIPFAVDVEKIKAVFGCKDRTLMEQIKHADLYDNYANQSDESSFPEYRYDFDDALEDIFFRYVKPEDRKTRNGLLGFLKAKQGTGLNAKVAHGYGYVLLVICDYFGTHLLPFCDGFYYGRDFNAAIAIMKAHGLELELADMFEQHAVFDIPAIADFPAIKRFCMSEIKHINLVMSRISIDEVAANIDSDDYDEVQGMLKDIRDGFLFCEQQQLEMITFAH